MTELYTPETYVISRCLVDQSLVPKAIRAGIRPTDFVDPVWARIWDVIGNSAGRQLPAREIAKKVAGVALLAETAVAIMSACEYAPTSCYFDHYCRRVVEIAMHREATDIAAKINDSDTAEDIQRLSADLQRCQHRLAAGSDTEEEAYSVDLARAATDVDDTDLSGVDAFLLPTDGMDRHIGGPLPAGQLIVVAAASGNYKSTFLLQMFCRNAKHHSCAFMSLEMNSKQVGVRLHAMGHGDLDDAFLVTRPSMNATKLIARMEELHERGYDTFGIDYGQLVEESGNKSLYEQQTKIANCIQDVTKRLGITTVVATQLRKQDNSGGRIQSPPGIDDIRDTGRWREAPDVLILLDKVWERYRDADKTKAYEKACDQVTTICLEKGTSLGQAFIVSFVKMRDRAKPYEKFYAEIHERKPLIVDPYVEPTNRVTALDDFNEEVF